MQHLAMLGSEIGGTWVGVRFCAGNVPAGGRVASGMRICEAIRAAVDEVLILPIDKLGCPGAARTSGACLDDEGLAAAIARKHHVAVDKVRVGIADTPTIPGGIDAIAIGKLSHWDVAVAYTVPGTAMKLLRRWQENQGDGPALRMSTIMGVCGNVVAATYERQRIQVSLGCPTAREAGLLDEEHVVIGVPYSLMGPLFGVDAEERA